MPPRPAFQKAFSLNGVPYAVATRDGISTWTSALEPAAPTDLLPQVLRFPFGSGGMGSSLPAVRNQMSYALDMDAEGWDLLQPGPRHAKLGLALDAPVASLTTLRDNDAAANWYLYIGAGAVTVKKRLRQIGANPALGTVETVTHTHAAAPVVTQIMPVKDGPDIGGRGGTVQPSTCRAIVLFGASAQIRQINVVGVDAADTWQAVAGTAAYGGYGVMGPGSAVNNTRIWKTTSFTIAGNAGAFGALQGATVVETAMNLTIASAWTPDPPYPIGGRGSPITALVMFGGGVQAWKPEGGFAFDGVYQPQALMTFDSFRYDDNGRNAVGWGEDVFIPTGQDVHQWPGRVPPTMGISTVLSNLSPVRGRPTVIAPFDRYVFVAYHDPTSADSFIVKARHKELIASPHDYLFYPQVEVSGHKVAAMKVTSDGGGNVSENIYLFYGCASDTPGKYDVGYCVLSGPAYQYATGGTLVTTAQGDPNKTTRATRLSVFGRDCDAGNSYAIRAIWDLAAASTAIGAGAVVNTNGRNTFDWTPGVNDSGNYLALEITNITAQPKTSGPPQLVAASSDYDGPGGVQIDVLRQPDSVRRVRVILNLDHAQTYTGGPKRESPIEELRALEALTAPGVLTRVVDFEEFGDNDARPYIVQSVKEVRGTDARGLDGAGRYAEVTMIAASMTA